MTPPAPGAAPGLRDELKATRTAATRLVKAHVELAKAELTDILDEVKRFAIAGGIALALLFFLGMLVPVGLTLFLGEWLFGSIGWGVLHGVEISVAVGLVAVLAALGLPARKIARAFLVALVIGVVIGVLFAFNLPHQAWSRLGDNLFSGIGPDIRPLVTALVGSVVALAVLGLLLGLAIGRGVGAAIGGFFLGLVLGLPFGALTAISFGGQPGAGLGLAVGILAWIIGLIVAVVRHGIDLDALKARLWPQQTIDTTKETIEWVRAQTPLGPKS
jgi:hypothetical protein